MEPIDAAGRISHMKHKLLTPLMLFIAATVFLAACASDETALSTSGSPDEADLPADVDLPADSTGDAPLTSDESDTPDESAAPDTTDLPDQDLPIKSDDVDESTTVPPGDVFGAGPYPVATLDITISHPDAADVSYTISCLGDTATVIGDVGIDERVACPTPQFGPDWSKVSRKIRSAPSNTADPT